MHQIASHTCAFTTKNFLLFYFLSHLSTLNYTSYKEPHETLTLESCLYSLSEYKKWAKTHKGSTIYTVLFHQVKKNILPLTQPSWVTPSPANWMSMSQHDRGNKLNALQPIMIPFIQQGFFFLLIRFCIIIQSTSKCQRKTNYSSMCPCVFVLQMCGQKADYYEEAI